MNLSDDQVVSLLISNYRQRGVDLSELLKDKVFEQLPLASKVDAIKKYSGELSRGTNDKFGIRDARGVAAEAALGAISGMTIVPRLNSQGILTKALSGLKTTSPAASNFVGKLINKHSLRFAGLIGATAGAGVGLLLSKREIDARKRVKDILNTTYNNPTDDNGVLTLSLANSASNSTGSRFGNNIIGQIPSAVEQGVSKFHRNIASNYVDLINSKTGNK